MTGAEIIEGDGSIRVGRAARKAADRPLPADTGAPEQRLDEVMKNLSAAETRASTAEQNAAAATARANDASAAAAAATEARIGEREVALKNAVAQGTDAVKLARSAYRAAREAGDLDAEENALATMTSAATNLKVAELELSQFSQAKPRLIEQAKEAAKPVDLPKGPTQATQDWLRDHPRFQTDEDYKAEAIKAQGDASQTLGYAPGSKESIGFINKRMERLFGRDHGKEPAAGQDREHDPGPERGSGNGAGADMSGISTSAGPGRGSGGAAGSSLRLVQGSDGKPQLSGTIPKEWVEAASWNNMSPTEYAISMLEHEAERRQGKAVYSQDGMGAVWRTG